MKIELSQLQPETSVVVSVFDPGASDGMFRETMSAGWLRAMLAGDPGFRADVLGASVEYSSDLSVRVCVDA